LEGSEKEAKDFLLETRFNGIMGEWWFNANGDIQGLAPIINVIRSGKKVQVSTASS